VGFEALYWLPFLEKLKMDGIDPHRMIPITRGGAAVWYGTPTGLELYAMRSPQEVRVENRIQGMKTGLQKQIAITAWDRDVIKDAAKTLGLTHYHVLHPAVMYQLFEPFWNGQRGIDWLAPQGQFGFGPPPPLPDGVKLPEQFVAVRFYLRATFPNDGHTIKFAHKVIRHIADQWPVVLLNSNTHADEHLDIEVKGHPRIQQLSDLISLTPETNLAVQSAVLARSVGFVGTYGGLAQLALRFARPSVSFFKDWNYTAMAHKHLADGISLRSGIPFLVHAIKDVAMAKSVLPDIMLSRS
jgi:hypothetical protein